MIIMVGRDQIQKSRKGFNRDSFMLRPHVKWAPHNIKKNILLITYIHMVFRNHTNTYFIDVLTLFSFQTRNNANNACAQKVTSFASLMKLYWKINTLVINITNKDYEELIKHNEILIKSFYQKHNRYVNVHV